MGALLGCRQGLFAGLAVTGVLALPLLAKLYIALYTLSVLATFHNKQRTFKVFRIVIFKKYCIVVLHIQFYKKDIY